MQEARRSFIELRGAAVRVQAAWRGYCARQAYLRLRSASVTLQVRDGYCTMTAACHCMQPKCGLKAGLCPDVQLVVYTKIETTESASGHQAVLSPPDCSVAAQGNKKGMPADVQRSVLLF